MDFHIEFTPKKMTPAIRHSDKLLLIGSCFTEQMGNKLMDHKFEVLQNPNGILFNPISIANAILSYAENKVYTRDDFFLHNELWNSWQHHSRFSGTDKEAVLKNINKSQASATKALANYDWLFVTLGSAFVYEREEISSGYFNNRVVANCHKIPTDKFTRRLLSFTEVEDALKKIRTKAFEMNPAIKIVFTVSPVRHLREGFIENNRSKATLIQAVHNVVDNQRVHYFPAYELIIDDLRDYRFYAEDMVHPNYSATNYVWEKFIKACVDEGAQDIMKEVYAIKAAVDHKPFNEQSGQHKKFKETYLAKILTLTRSHDYLNFDEEIEFLSK